MNAEFSYGGAVAQLSSFCDRNHPLFPTPTGLCWHYAYYLVIEPVEEQGLQWFLDTAALLRELFVFLIGSGVYTLDLMGVCGTGESRDSELEIWCPSAIPRTVRHDSWYFSTRHKNFRQAMPNIVKEWFEKYEKFRVLSTCYTELLCADGIAPNTILLRAAQTLKHVYGLVWPESSKYVEGNAFKRLTKYFCKMFPNELKDVPSEEMDRIKTLKGMLVSRFGGINSLSYQSRLERLLKAIPGNELNPILGNPRNLEAAIEEFLKRLVKTRHYLSHYNEANKLNTFSPEETEEATLICWAVLTFWMAKLLRLSDSQAGHMAIQGREALFLIQPQFRL